MNLEFFVSRRKLTRKGFPSVVADTRNTDTFTVSFDKEWDGLLVDVTLKNGPVSVTLPYFGKTALPAQVCGSGNLTLTCKGYLDRDRTTCVLSTLPMVHPVKIAGCAPDTEHTGQPYTPSAYEQMLTLLAEAKALAAKAEAAGTELLALKESGALQGQTGKAATVRVEGVYQGSPARVENLGTEHEALLRFTLPYTYALTDKDKQQIAALWQQELHEALDAVIELQNAYIEGVAS